MSHSSITANYKVELRYDELKIRELQELLSVINDREVNERAYCCGFYIPRIERHKDYDYDGYGEPTDSFDVTITIVNIGELYSLEDIVNRDDFELAKRIRDYIKTKTGIE